MSAFTQTLEENGFSVERDGDNLCFGFTTPAGEDCNVEVNIKSGCLSDQIWEEWDNFDVSTETYYWLDNSGHGANGAPYDMRDLYNDMEAHKELLYQLYTLLRQIEAEEYEFQ